MKDPKVKAKLTKQAQDEKELLDKCVQIQAQPSLMGGIRKGYDVKYGFWHVVVPLAVVVAVVELTEYTSLAVRWLLGSP